MPDDRAPGRPSGGSSGGSPEHPSDELLRVDIADEAGVFTVRQAGRRVAAAVGLDQQDQVRVGTALSEIGRELYSYAGSVAAVFRVDREGRPALVVELSFGPRDGATRALEGFEAATRLMDKAEEEGDGDAFTVRLRKHLPPNAPPVDARELADLRARLARLRPLPALEELHARNSELIEALEDVRRQREGLRALNAELEETNRGVMALYNELSQELEETNRGVVALYAELEEKSDQLREAGEAKNRFWANISHELRTPVNGIIGLTRLLLDPAADPLTGEQRHQISLIGDTGDTLLSLVNELLDMAKAEQGRLEPRLAPVDVPALLRELAALLRPMAEQAGLTLHVDSADAPPRLVGDGVMLSRILRNLLGNAVKFTTEGEVRLTVRSTPQYMEFVVSDTGVGIPPADRERVFEEFYQVPGTRTGGTGLGLPYARRLARALGGDLLLDSVLGEGTTVTLRLPPYQSMTGGELGHVLIVDDDETARRSLRALVGGAAERISEAADGRSALAGAASDPPDLVLLDLRMPGGDGREVLAGLPPAVPVVLVTSADVSAEAELERADALLGKDRLGPETLADAVGRAVARRAREVR
ncbi:ATP-binding protein [Actinomadura fibrosa]|uniref:histidine kinase n=1 Tax=Actinomadura fibrosa TaxID=111802 RepID=A0ABW2XCX0_9ACTN|nr:ATP-binding protein [Actinomadura fibrosa]